MDDLRRRFASLDRLPAPDLWDTIELRATTKDSVTRVTAVVTPLPMRPRRSSRRSFVLLATAAALVVLVAGAVAIGSRRPLLSTIVPVPSAPIPAAPSGLASDGQAPWIVFGFNWSDDSPAGVGSSLWAMRPDGSGAHEILAQRDPGAVAWSRDGTRLLTNGNIRVAEVGEDIGPFVDSGVEQPVNEQWEAFDFAPDGERVVFVRKSKCSADHSTTDSASSGVVLAAFVAETAGANCYVLSILDLRTRERTDLDQTLVMNQTDTESTGSLELELPAWSPDGARIAYTREGQSTRIVGTRELWVVNADGTNPSRVELAADVSVREPRWSPDGTRISFTSETPIESAVYVAELATGRLERVTIGSDPAARQLCCAEWLDNTRLRVAGSARSDPDRFWLVALDATPHEAQVLVDLTESLAAIEAPGYLSMRSAPGDPGRTFQWQPVPGGQP